MDIDLMYIYIYIYKNTTASSEVEATNPLECEACIWYGLWNHASIQARKIAQENEAKRRLV